MVESVVQSHAEIVVGSDEKKLIRILHVDDELGLLKVAKQCLELQGPFHVDTACSVEEALAKLEKERYDAVVSDYQMPGKDGLEFLKALRKNGNSIPFIMFTGKGREEVALKAWNLGADHYVNKAGDPETVYCELAHCLRSTVEKHFAEAQMKETVQKLHTLYQNAVEGITYVDPEENIVYANKAFADIVGYEQDQLLGMNLHKIVDDENWAKIENETKQRWQGESSRYEAQLRRRDGTVRNVLISGAPTLDHNGRFVGTSGIVLDITERKKAEGELRKSEERYRSYVEVTGQLGWSTNANGEVEEDIPAWRRFTGQSPEEVRGWGWTKALHPDDLEHATQVWEKDVATRSSYEVEYRVRRYDGVYRNFLAHGVPVLNEDGSIREWVGACIDITERIRAEKTLQESEEKYRSLVELAPDGVVAVDAEGIVTSTNCSFLKLVGYGSEEEIVGKPFTELMTMRMEDIPRFQGMFTSLMKGESPSPSEFLYVRRDGTTRWAEVHPGLLIKDGHPVGVQAIMRDVTERKNAEKRVQDNQQMFEQLFMSNPEAVVYVDQNERVLNASPRFAELFGYSFDEVKGKFLDDFVVPEDRKQEALMLAQKGREGNVYYETVRKNKEGSLIPVALSSAPIVLQGQLAGCIGVYKDISELKKTEHEMAMMNEKLRVVGGLTRHDVRNKLSTITGNAYLLKKQLADNKEVLGKLRDMETAVSQVTRIFDFAKDYEMLGVEELTYIDLQKSVNEAVQLFQDLKGVRVLNECHGLTVLSDSLLRQLFYNLIDNSLKYGEKLSQIRIHCEKAEGNQLRLVYEDDGVGISQDAKPKLFDEGFTTGKGSGYGLYLIRRMMEVYGWTIQETGTPGKGARFTVTIPEKNQNGKENYQLH